MKVAGECLLKAAEGANSNKTLGVNLSGRRNCNWTQTLERTYENIRHPRGRLH
jgi:hypothetical protein